MIAQGVAPHDPAPHGVAYKAWSLATYLYESEFWDAEQRDDD